MQKFKQVREYAGDMAQAKATGKQRRAANLEVDIRDKSADIGNMDPSQKTKIAIAKADLSHMKLKLGDIKNKIRLARLSAENEPETDDTGKPNKKKEIKEDERLSQILRIKKAIEIAKKMAGNLTGATKEIEKIAKGLSKEKDVETALMKANEELQEKAEFRLSYSDKYGKHAGFEDAKTFQDLQNRAQKLRSKGYKIDKMGRNTSPVNEALQPGWAVRYSLDGKRKVQAYKTEKDAEHRAKILRAMGGVKDVSITKHTLNFKEYFEFLEACWKGYKQVGMKDKGGRQVPNCVPDPDNKIPKQQKEDKDHDCEKVHPKMKHKEWMNTEPVVHVKEGIIPNTQSAKQKAYNKFIKQGKHPDTAAEMVANLVAEDSNVKYKVVDAKTNKPISDLKDKSVGYNTALLMKKQKGPGYEIKPVDAYGNIKEVAPPGWEGSVRAMKKHPELGGEKGDKNIYALSWYLKNKGAKPHYKDKGGKPVKKDKYQNEAKILDEALRDMEDYRAKSKVLQSIQNDPKQMKDPQMRTAVMQRKQRLEKELQALKAKGTPIAAEVEPGTEKREVASFSKVNENKEDDIHFGISGIETDRQQLDEEKQMSNKYMETRKGSLEDSITKIRTEQPTVKKEEPNIKLEPKSYLETKEGSLADAAAKVVSEDTNIYINGSPAKVEDNTNTKSDDGKGLDKVQPKALKKKFVNRKDKDIDNDGSVDKQDKYIDNKRKAITKALTKDEGVTPEKQKEMDKLMKAFIARGGKIQKLKPGIAKGAGHMDRRGPYKKDMLKNKKENKSFKSIRASANQREVEKDLVASTSGGKGKTMTGRKPAKIDTAPKVNPI